MDQRSIIHDPSASKAASRKAERHSLTSQAVELGGGGGGTATERTLPDMQSLTQDEKISLLSGKSVWLSADLPQWNLQSVRLSDGPHGVRVPKKDLSLHDSHPATCFPTAAALACSWDEGVLYAVGRALSRECEYYKVGILLGPGMNIKRHPCGGRNFEYFSEDPYLTGRLATAYVRGVQASGKVGACPKHFAVNNQEDHRFVVTALVDERTAREIYLRHFQTVVAEARPETLMCAYNRVNGSFCSEHVVLNRQILRDEFGFDGVYMTDWGATNDRAAGVAAAVDLEMPGSHGVQDRGLRRALGSTRHPLTAADLDASARRVLRMIAAHQPTMGTTRNDAREFSSSSSHCDEVEGMELDWTAQHKIAKQAAMECAVLLQNDNDLLPLSRNTSIALIGDFAKEHPRYQGMGSSQVTTDGVVSAYDEAFKYTQNVFFAAGYHYDDDHVEDIDEAALHEAMEVAQQAEVAILFIGLPEIMESEGFDRSHCGIPAQHNALVQEICRVHDNVVVVLSNGGPVEMAWAPKAILEGYLLGESGGAAIVDLMFGQQSPCGRLAETFPIRQSDILADEYFPGTQERVEYREGLNVGYRYFDSANVPVRFPFGHGLAYTTFEYADFDVRIVDDSSKKNALSIEVSLLVTNSGEMDAKEVVQCYVHANDSRVYRPDQELKAFVKVAISPGTPSRVSFFLTEEAFSFYDVGVGKWVLEQGSYEIRVGRSSRDTRLRKTINLDMGEPASDLAAESYPPENETSLRRSVSDETFYGRFVTPFGSAAELLSMAKMPIIPFHRNTLLKDLSQRRVFGRFLLWIVYLGASADVKPGPTQARQKRLARIVVENLPLRTLVLFSRGGMTYELLDAILELMNYRMLPALKKFCIAFMPFRR